MTKRRYFGTDGVRGTVGQMPITPDFVLRLGYAAGKVLVNRQPGMTPTVLIGKDTRVSGYMLEAALEAGFSAAGVDVLLAGPMPTPAIAYLTRALRLAAGVVISASHNPYCDNGIKFFSSDGNKLPDETELLIESQLNFPIQCVESLHLGKARRLDDAPGRYIEFCKSTFPSELDLRGLKLVVDCAHGAAYHIAPHVFHELGADVFSIGNQPNGFNINEGYGVTSPDNLIKAVQEQAADFGIVLDGDADRLQMVDASGRLYNGDELLYVLAKGRLLQGEAVPGVVGTLMTNIGIEQAINKLGIPLERVQVGDRYVLKKLKENAWDLGAEASGHILCLDKHTSGDGIISALQVLATIRRHHLSLAEILKNVEVFPQCMINVKIPADYNSASTALQAERQAVESELGEQGRVLIRLSGTESVMRVMVEAHKVDLAEYYAQRLADAVSSELIPT